MPRVILAIFLIALIVYAAIDCITADSKHVRGVPKSAWIAIIILLPLLGALLWFFLGRPKHYSPPEQARRHPTAPDDDPNFLRNLETRRRQQQKEAELKARETELKNRETRFDEDGKDTK
ncbi:PLDc N-terminal domain-containing protein [Arthrobacter sp. H14]|uniref:PLDc N-terminal domain-containing protein n=1 Tax=Arthrobacter sp. H14 TaxID=1312959 RepID=UPI0004B15099|nr:PLDc N-terminal domain-containing protein [Arthrobacter sp. H14]